MNNMGTGDLRPGTGVRSSQSKLVIFTQSLRSKFPIPDPRPLIPFLLFSLLSFTFSLSCGLEEFYYLEAVPDSRITDNTSARIYLPSGSAGGYSAYFDNFMIYYRIYISGENFSGTEINTSDLRNKINSSLNSDFSGFYYLTDKSSTSANPSGLETVFTNRKYFKLTLEEGANIDNVLGAGSLGHTLEIRFSPNPGFIPEIELIPPTPAPVTDIYKLRRAVTGPGLNFRPEPDDRYFRNHPDLYNIQNVNDNINADTATVGTQSNPPRYTYVSMYIFAKGNDGFITTIYSQPTHIGIFQLPEAN